MSGLQAGSCTGGRGGRRRGAGEARECPSQRPRSSCAASRPRELRERLKPELLELVRQQRLLHLCEGTLFRKISSRRRQGERGSLHRGGGPGLVPVDPGPWGSDTLPRGAAAGVLSASPRPFCCRQALVLPPVPQPQGAALRGRGGGAAPPPYREPA